MTVYTPTKSLNIFIKNIENGIFPPDTTFIITGKNGPTGKTYLTNLLKKKGFNAIEITEDLLGLVDYVDDVNHFVLNQSGNTVTIMLNEQLVKNRKGRYHWDANDKIKDIISDYMNTSDVVFSEYLRNRIKSGDLELTDDEIKELLRLTGDDEYVTVDDIREE